MRVWDKSKVTETGGADLKHHIHPLPFCTPRVKNVMTTPSANIPVTQAPKRFSVSSMYAYFYRPPLIPSSTQLTRKPPYRHEAPGMPLGRKCLGRCQEIYAIGQSWGRRDNCYCFSNSSSVGKSKKRFPVPRQNLIWIVTFNPLHDDLPYMEVCRAMFLRARSYNLEKMAYPGASGRLWEVF